MTRTTKWPTKRPKTCRQMLDALDGWLSIGDNEQRHFSHVMSAMRGPDEYAPCWQGYRVKIATTALIRARALPRSARGLLGDVTFTDKEEWLITRTSPALGSLCSQHFEQHARLAFMVLGLSWERVNPPIKEEK